MKYSLIAVFVGLLTIATPSLAREVASLDEHEASLKTCFMSEGGCISKLIKDYLPDGNENLYPVADQVENIFTKWLATEKVVNVYKVGQNDLGDFISGRDYIIEDSGANIILFQMAYRRVLGKWHVFNFYLNSDQSEIKEILGY